MNREEAITELNTFKIGAKSEIGENALDIAIKSLEAWDKIKDEVYKIKHTLNAQNTDYQTGYLCALSVVEGIIAEKWEEKGEEDGDSN